MTKYKEILKIILYRCGILNIVSKIWYGTYFLLKEGYDPKRFWNGWSDDYARHKVQQKIDASQYWLLQQVEALRPSSVIEIGCGFGRNLKYLAEHLSYPVTLAGLDISQSMAHKAKSNLKDRSFIGCGDVRALPFSDASWDLVFTHAALMHVPESDIGGALAELRRIAKKDLLIIEETYWSIGRDRGLAFRPNDYTFIYDYRELAENGGLTIEEEREEKGNCNLIMLRCTKRGDGR